MKNCLIAAALMLGAVVTVTAAELKSGLPTGEKIPAFIVTKIAGAENDGVAVGKDLCYRCKYGARPQVMIFTRNTGSDIVSLAKELNSAVAKNESKQLSAFVNVLNSDKAAAEKAAKSLATAVGAEKLPVVVPVENDNGPANYGINPDAEVTVILANNSTVVATHGYAAGQFNAEAVKTVLSDVENLVK
jgi:hypothetical protein